MKPDMSIQTYHLFLAQIFCLVDICLHLLATFSLSYDHPVHCYLHLLLLIKALKIQLAFHKSKVLEGLSIVYELSLLLLMSCHVMH